MIERIVRGKQPIVCLDFSRDRLTALEVAEGAVTRWTSRPLVEDALRSGDPMLPGYMAESLRQALTHASIGARRARIALPDEATVSRQLTLPPMAGRDLARAMHYAAEKHIPFSIDRARWAWDVIDRTSEGTVVYLVATWRDVVDRYAEITRTAGLEPEVLEPRTLAVARALDQEQALVLDADRRRLHALLVVTGQPTYVDEVLVGNVVEDRREALDRLLQRAYRYQSSMNGAAGRLAPVLLAGGLEHAELPLPVAARPVSDVLNGQLPRIPVGFQPGAYLANLGLSMRSAR